MLEIPLQFAAVIAALLLQISVFGHIRPLGVIPDLVMVAVIMVALWGEATATLAIAVAAGLITDLASSSDFGLRTGFFTVIALTVIAARQLGVHTDSLAAALVILVLATLISNLVIVASLGPSITVDWSVVGARIGAEMVVNVAALLVLFGAKSIIGDRRSRVATELNRRSWL